MTSALNAVLNAMDLDDESESIHDDEVLDVDADDEETDVDSVSIADEETETETEEEDDAPSGDGNETSEDEEGVLSESSEDEETEADADDEDDRMSTSEEEDKDAEPNLPLPPLPSLPSLSSACQPNKRKRKNSRRWLQQVNKAQATYNLLLPGAPFRRLVREIGDDYKSDLRFTSEAFLALQEVSESHLIETFDMSNIMAIHRGGITIQPKDMQVARMVSKKFKWN
jgi:histone H3/H4